MAFPTFTLAVADEVDEGTDDVCWEAVRVDDDDVVEALSGAEDVGTGERSGTRTLSM